MTNEQLTHKGAAYLRKLALGMPNRRTGSRGNEAATKFFAREAAAAGFTVETPEFECLDWSQDGALLRVGNGTFLVQTGPYSPGCQVIAGLAVAATLAELELADLTGRVLLLRGEIAKEQLMPKNFPFYNPEEHQHIIRLLESKQPLAIIAATSENPELAGAVAPFPLIEDGDFNIPSVFTSEAQGERLARYAGEDVMLEIRAQRSPARGCNVIARKGDPQRRVVVFAHIDAKDGTPGAIDNAGGVVVLLLLAGLLADYTGKLGVELVAMNGEDYYCSPGEQLYLRQNAGRFEEIVLGVNIDGAGYVVGKTAFSLYNCPVEIDQAIRRAFSAHPGLAEGEPWYQGDHGLFLLNQRPALAVTSEQVLDLERHYVHTMKDTPEIVDPAKLAEVAISLHDLILTLDQTL
jgi:aminopeptidase YwaD